MLCCTFGNYLYVHAFHVLSFVSGGAGWTGIVAYAAYNFKNRRGGSASMYVMHYRVVAQFAFIGTVGLGLMGAVTYSAFRKSLEENNKKKAIKSAEESVSHR